MQRLDVIHAIGAALTEQIWQATHDDTQFDPAAYAAAIDKLGASGSGGKRGVKRQARLRVRLRRLVAA